MPTPVCPMTVQPANQIPHPALHHPGVQTCRSETAEQYKTGIAETPEVKMSTSDATYSVKGWDRTPGSVSVIGMRSFPGGNSVQRCEEGTLPSWP